MDRSSAAPEVRNRTAGMPYNTSRRGSGQVDQLNGSAAEISTSLCYVRIIHMLSEHVITGRNNALVGG